MENKETIYPFMLYGPYSIFVVRNSKKELGWYRQLPNCLMVKVADLTAKELEYYNPKT